MSTRDATVCLWQGNYYCVERSLGGSYSDNGGTHYVQARVELCRGQFLNRRLGGYCFIKQLKGRAEMTKAAVEALIDEAKRLDAAEPARLELKKAQEEAQAEDRQRDAAWLERRRAEGAAMLPMLMEMSSGGLVFGQADLHMDADAPVSVDEAGNIYVGVRLRIKPGAVHDNYTWNRPRRMR